MENTRTVMSKEQEHKPEETTAENQQATENENVENAESPRAEEPQAADAESQNQKETAVDDKLSVLEQEKSELQDKYLRLYAEFDNFRRRTLLEKDDLRKQANRDIFTELVSVVDDFERGLENIEQTESKEALKEGVKLIYHKFTTFLSKKGVEVMKTKEEPFDPELHEALTKIPAPDKKLKGKVIDEVQKGYMLHDKVLRYAKVVVAE